MESAGTVRVQLLGGFRVELPDGRIAGPWERPYARRLFEVVILRERRRIGREEVADLLFQDLAPPGRRTRFPRRCPWRAPHCRPSPCWEPSGTSPGDFRDAALVAALAHRGRLLDDELYADWATAEREALERLRADASMALARDRSAGHGRASPHAVADAWSHVLAQDCSNEEACSALLDTYAGLGQPDQLVRTYRWTVIALHRLGLEPSAELQGQYRGAVSRARAVGPSRRNPAPARTAFGRDATRAALLDSITSPDRRSGPTVLLSGPPGIGKSHT